MSIPARVIATALLLGLVGCVNSIQGNDDTSDSDDTTTDDGDGGDDGDAAARAAFDDGVYPILAAKCMSCHGTTGNQSTPFVAPTLTDAYAYVVGSNAVGNFTTAGAPLYYKVVPGPHNAQTFENGVNAGVSGGLDAGAVYR